MNFENPKFRKFNTDIATIELIKKIQNDFEIFYGKLKPNCSFNNEHKIALERLQESCMWFTRGIAQAHHYKKTTNKTTETKIIIKKSKLNNHEQKTL